MGVDFYEIESSTDLAIIPKESGCCGFHKQVMNSYPDPSGKDNEANIGSSMNIKIREDLFVPWLASFPFCLFTLATSLLGADCHQRTYRTSGS